MMSFFLVTNPCLNTPFEELVDDSFQCFALRIDNIKKKKVRLVTLFIFLFSARDKKEPFFHFLYYHFLIANNGSAT
jgi:hypothetical protein